MVRRRGGADPRHGRRLVLRRGRRPRRARALVDSAPNAELFLYPGDQHLFTDRSLPSFDEQATALLTERELGFLASR